MTAEIIREKLLLNGIPFSEGFPEKLRQYLELLTEWNGKMDLTAVTEEEDMLDRHFIDSLTVVKTGLLKNTGSVIDVGTGAGFPGMVLALLYPALSVTLLDSQQKRLGFLEKVCESTGAENVALVHARAEDAGRDPGYRERYDYAIARAVAPLNVLCEYLLPFVRLGGRMICWKGPTVGEETGSAEPAAKQLGALLEKPIPCRISGRDWDHLLVPAIKTGHTPNRYPRNAGIPKRKPLGKQA